jgi:acid phosphatase (class A)
VGAHWQTDVDASRMGASIGYGALQSNPTFREDMKAARQEYLRKKNKK